jgi:acetolactate synthase-1/2/3 large subunit
MKTTGAALLLKLLERQGIETVAGIPGGASLPIYDALNASPIRHVLARHEQGAGFIAQGMARATGRPAVCFGTSGPGATNLLTAIADAKLDSIPLVAITAQVPRAMIGSDAFQEIDTYGLTVPITKHNWLVRSAAELLDVVPEAFRVASSGRPGPVVIDVPKDVQTEAIELRGLPHPGRADAPPPVDDGAIRRAAELLAAAQRPVLLIGAGVIGAGAGERVRRLAERASIPVACTLLGLGALPCDHPLSLGMVGMHGAPYVNLVLEECDLLLAIGMRFDDRATGKASAFCPNARVIHVDVDASEIGTIRKPAVAVRADAAHALDALLPLVAPRRRAAWRARVDALRAAAPLAMPGANDATTAYGIVRAAAEIAGDDAIVTTDVGQHQMWVAQAYPFRHPRQCLTSGGLGTMGFGLPAAIGAALAAPQRPVLCFTGDGSLLMNLQELATAAEERVNVKIILLNNGHLGLVRQQQQLFYGGRYQASRFRTEPDFAALARAFGIDAVRLGDASDPRGALAAALASPGPCLVDVPIAREQNVYPMVPPGAANRDMLIAGESHADAAA